MSKKQCFTCNNCGKAYVYHKSFVTHVNGCLSRLVNLDSQNNSNNINNDNTIPNNNLTNNINNTSNINDSIINDSFFDATIYNDTGCNSDDSFLNTGFSCNKNSKSFHKFTSLQQSIINFSISY